jgi:hypothetical protein
MSRVLGEKELACQGEPRTIVLETKSGTDFLAILREKIRKYDPKIMRTFVRVQFAPLGQWLVLPFIRHAKQRENDPIGMR